MTPLIAGMALFGLTHMFSRARGLRAQAIERLGSEMAYKGVYSLVALGALTLIVTGYRATDFIYVYDPIEGARSAAHAIMPLALILAAGANMRSNLKRYVRHPLSIAVILWAAVHLAANGDLASVILFGGFLLYAAVNLGLTLQSEPSPPPPPQPRYRDLILIVAGLVAYGVAIWAHRAIFGVAVTGG